MRISDWSSDVCSSDLGALPVVLGDEGRVLRLVGDGGRIEQDLRAHQRHGARALRKPLVPADGGAQRAVARVPHPKAGVAGIEVVFFLVARPVGNVRLAIDAEPAAVGVDHRQRSEEHTSELHSLRSISYDVLTLKKKNQKII